MSDQLEDLGKKLLEILKTNGKAFIEQNASEALGLGKDLCEALLTQALFRVQVAHLPALPRDASMADIAAREGLCTALSRQAQLIAAAERENAARLKQIQEKAMETATTIAVNVGSVCLQSLVVGLLAK
jgi:hypothetical protein